MKCLEIVNVEMSITSYQPIRSIFSQVDELFESYLEAWDVVLLEDPTLDLVNALLALMKE